VAVWKQLDLPLGVRDEPEPAPQKIAAGGNTRVAVFPPAGG
jgi:hypothetical protein